MDAFTWIILIFIGIGLVLLAAGELMTRIVIKDSQRRQVIQEREKFNDRPPR